LKPNSVQEINFLGCEMRSVWSQVEDLLLACGCVNDKCQLRLGIGQPLPCEPSNTSFFGEWAIGRSAQHDSR
jgi:hypothetical protein